MVLLSYRPPAPRLTKGGGNQLEGLQSFWGNSEKALITVISILRETVLFASPHLGKGNIGGVQSFWANLRWRSYFSNKRY